MPFKKALKNTPAGKLFVFEGSDGVGKTTVAEKVAEDLRRRGGEVLLLSFPGREPKTLGKLVYKIHHNAKSFGLDHVSPASLQILHVAAHIDCIEGKIIPALFNNKTVILDRYWWSPIVYGMVAGVARQILDAIVATENIAWRDIKPERLFLLTRDEPFTDEISSTKWLKICNAYKTLALQENKHYPVHFIDNSETLGKIAERVVEYIYNGPGKIDGKKKSDDKLHDGSLHQKLKRERFKSTRWSPTKPTEVFDTYWRFAAARQEIFFKRFKGEKEPWTDDLILKNYKFTNAYRVSDRVSQFLIRHVIYGGDQDPKEIFFRTLLFKTFNKIETWKLFEEKLGNISWRDYDFRIYDPILTKAKSKKKSIYSAAYIMPSGGNSFGHRTKHRNHLTLLKTMMDDDLPTRICHAKSMHEVFELLRSYPMIGDFLAYQYAIDINYSILTDFSEMSFVMPGPGAKDGLQKCFSDYGGLSEVDLIKLMADRQEDEFARLGIQFKSLWGRPLQLIDCQNLFCEVDKYARIAHPEIKGITGRSRIKQTFKPTLDPIEYFYPPRWNLKSSIANMRLEK